MSNDVATIKTRPVGYYNQNKGENVLALSIRVKPMQTKDGKKFNKIEVFANYKKFFVWKSDVDLTKCIKDGKYISDEYGDFSNIIEDVGARSKWTNLSFLENAFDNVPEECSIKSPSKLVTGTLYVKAKGVDKKSSFGPYLDKDGKVKYTKVWIKSDIVGFEALTIDQDEFSFNQEPHQDVIETVCDENGVVEVETPTEECSM